MGNTGDNDHSTDSLKSPEKPAPSLLLKRLVQWFFLIFGLCSVYYLSWGRYAILPEDPRNLEFLEKQKLEAQAIIAGKSGTVTSQLYESQLHLAEHYLFYKHYETAVKELKERLHTADLLFGENSAQARQALTDLAGCFRDWKKYGESEKIYKQILSSDANEGDLVLGKDLNNLAVLYCLWGQSEPSLRRRQSRFELSVHIYNDALDKLKNQKGTWLYRVALRNKAVVLSEMGLITEAEAARNEADKVISSP